MICVIETIEALPGRGKDLKKALTELVPLSRKEEGCVAYDLFQEEGSADRFAVVMRWQDRAAYDRHNAAPHILKFMEKFDGILYKNVVETLYNELEAN